MNGFGSPGYVNIIYPHRNEPPLIGDEYNPVSSYRTTFTVPPEWKGRRVILRFNGVYSAYYVWVNGKKVGYAEDSSLPSEFDITSYLCPAQNSIAVEVYRWSDGSTLRIRTLSGSPASIEACRFGQSRRTRFATTL